MNASRELTAGPILCCILHSSDLQVQVGVRKAHQLAQQHDLKLVPVHHMEAHALVARVAADVQFPFLCMLVSGGHNMLLIAHQVGNYTLLGSTLDDSVGLFSLLPATIGPSCLPSFHAHLALPLLVVFVRYIAIDHLRHLVPVKPSHFRASLVWSS